jgi:hypothetical protein
MANELTVAQVVGTDMVASEIQKVNEYIEKGLPGIAEVTDVDLHRMLNLYLNGSTYTQISNMLRIKKDIILYLAHHSGWYNKKIECINEIQEKIKNRIMESKIKNKEFVLLAAQALRQKIGGKMSAYLASGIDTHMEEIDNKELIQLMKTIEIIEGLDSTGKKNGKTPAVGINIGEGVTVERTGDDKVSITPKENSVGDYLKEFADRQREIERNKLLEAESKSGTIQEKEQK